MTCLGAGAVFCRKKLIIEMNRVGKMKGVTGAPSALYMHIKGASVPWEAG